MISNEARHQRLIRIWRIVTAALVVVCMPYGVASTTTTNAGDADHVPLQGQLLSSVLSSYESLGYRFLYSTGLVRPNLRLRMEPASSDPLDRLTLALQDIGLTLYAQREGTWLIVRDTRADGATAPTAQPSPSPSPASAGTLGMEEVIVVSSRYAVHDTETRAHAIDLGAMSAVPRLGDDPLRITNHLPGMSTLGVSAKPHVRGGSQDELLVLFNNIELLEPFHLRDFRSIFSSFDPNLVESIEVYTGGFPARYGDRMSGVMDIHAAEVDRQRGGEINISTLSTGIAGFGTYGDGRGRWLASARRGNLDLLTDQINASVGTPRYNDWLLQSRYTLASGAELDVGLLAYNDDIELSDFDEDGEIASSRYENAYAWAQLHQQLTPALDSTSLIYLGGIRHERDGLLVDEDLDNGEAFVDDRRRFQLASLLQQFRYTPTHGLHVEFGARLNYYKGRYDYDANIERGALWDFLQSAASAQDEPAPEGLRYERLRPQGASGGIFSSLRTRLHKTISMEAGIRWDFQNYGARRRSQFSPRFSVKLDPRPTTQIRFSAGRFFQPEAIHELQIGDGITHYQRPQYADHYILGWHQAFGTSSFSLRTELFSKSFHRPKRRYENVFNPLVLLPELASDRIGITPAKARARGVEATFSYQPDNGIMAWLSMSHAETEDYVNGEWRARAWDQGLTVSAGLSWQNERWSFGAALLRHDGWRTYRLPGLIAEDEVPDVSRYSHRMRDYLTLDLRVARTWRWPGQSLTAFLEITNALNRRNLGGIEYDVEELEDDDGGFQIITNEETLLPLVPSLGIRWQF